jgi:hypothetical protein
MSQKACLASSDAIAVQVTSNPRSDRILSKSCAATARESISLGGCHLSSTMPAIPDIPTAHLWKYDCMAPAVETRRAAETTTTSRGTPIGAATPAATAAIATSPQPTPASTVEQSDSDAPASATVNAGDAGSSQQPTPPAETSSTSTAPTPPTAVADDLVPVRTKDPEAADRIVSYCSKITSGASNPTTVAARCRQDEMEAWNRLTQNEFPTLDETSRRKCNEPPFPDSFVARETCAKYQLHLD